MQCVQKGEQEVGPLPQPPPFLPKDTSKRVDPRALHLRPVTWESLNDIWCPPDEHFDIVDGLLVWVPMAHGTTKHQRVIRGLVQLVNLIDPWSAISGIDVEVDSLNSKSTDPNRRGPDVTITRADESPTSSESSPSTTQAKQERHVIRTKDIPPFAVMEVTSKSTRLGDLTTKWLQYCRTGIRFYYIIDLHQYETSKQVYVIVGSKYAFADAILCSHGSPDAPPSDWNPSSHSAETLYYKKVYSGDEKVNVGIFRGSQYKASQLIDTTFLKKRVKDLRDHNTKLNEKLNHMAQDMAALAQDKATLTLDKATLTQENAALTQKLREARAQIRSAHRSSSSHSNPKAEPKKDKQTVPPRKRSTKSLAQSRSKVSPKSPRKKRPKSDTTLEE